MVIWWLAYGTGIYIPYIFNAVQASWCSKRHGIWIIKCQASTATGAFSSHIFSSVATGGCKSFFGIGNKTTRRHAPAMRCIHYIRKSPPTASHPKNKQLRSRVTPKWSSPHFNDSRRRLFTHFTYILREPGCATRILGFARVSCFFSNGDQTRVIVHQRSL